MPSKSEDLNLHDCSVLARVFNPDDPLAPFSSDLEEDQMVEQKLGWEDDFMNALTNVEVKIKLRSRELEAVSLVREGRYDDAKAIFDDLIEQFPKYTSAWNNRAQLKQLLHDRHGALDDLNSALNLNHPTTKCISICMALCQRGIILHSLERSEEAMYDFKRAAAWGSPFAKKMVIQLNPYAALCNQMLTDMMKSLREDVAS